MKRIATTPKQFPLLARRPVPTLLACALAGCLAVMAPAAMAQSTAATIRGQVTVDAAPASDARVTATNVATGLSRSVQASASGAYSLVGLPPGTYRVDVTANGATTSQTVTVQVGQTATLDLAAGGVAETGPVDDATDVGTVTVTAPVLVEARTSEVATYVSQKQIEALPQGSRNFLAFADTVPGDIALAGFDDIPLARYVHPSLTTIRVNIAEIGERAVLNLLSQMAEGDGDASTQAGAQLMDVKLVVRESSAARPRTDSS